MLSHPVAPKPTVKTALVLAGGGLTGAVYEIGALRAIDDLLVDLDTSSFDIYVGTSAGAMVAAFLANGIRPAELMRGLDNQHPRFRGPRRSDIFTPNLAELADRVRDLPRTLLGAANHYLRHWREMRPVDAALALTETLPTALFDNRRLASYIREVIEAAGGHNHFKALQRELYIIATDLDSGQRAVFGEGELADIPISMAVAASSAVPLLYRPVRIGDHDYVDGGVRGMASLDVAIEHGAQLVVVVNSAVPLDNSQRDGIPFLNPRGRYVSDKGMPAVFAQVYRTLSHAGLAYHIKQITRQHPDVTIIVIEPDPTDSAMFFFNSMRYSARMTIAEHGYESVTVNLAQDYHTYKDLLSRYGIAISSDRVNAELALMQQADHAPDAIQAVMESDYHATKSPSEERSEASPLAGYDSLAAAQSDKPVSIVPPTDRLEQVLRDLETALARRQANPPAST